MGFPSANATASRVKLPQVTTIAAFAWWCVSNPKSSRRIGAPTEDVFHRLHCTKVV
jgi:hypothetical protein